MLEVAEPTAFITQPESCDDCEDEACWICLSSVTPLVRPCACPRLVHQKCLARWQLQQAGKR